MGRPQLQSFCSAWKYRLSRQGVAGYVGLCALLLMPGCAQLDRLLGKDTSSVEPSASVPAPNATQAQPAEPKIKSVTKTPDDVQPANAGAESPPQTPVAAPARTPTPAMGAANEPEPDIKKAEQDTTLVEKEQPPKEKKSRAASDRKSKKTAKPKPSTEDDFLPPIPLPSKPAAIGGSGG